MHKFARIFLLTALLAGLLLGAAAVKAEAPEKEFTFNVKGPECGAVGDGLTNDTAAIQSCIDKMESLGEGTLYFPRGTYVTDSLTLHGNNLNLIGENAVLKSNLPHQSYPEDANAVRESALIKSEPRNILFRVDPQHDIHKGDAFVDLTDGVSTDAVNIGDIVLIETSKANPRASTYQYGSYRYVEAIQGNRLILDDAIEHDLLLATDDVKITVVKPITNLKVTGLTLEIPADTYQNGIVLEHLRNATFSYLRVTAGGQNMVGISTTGFNIRVRQSEVSGFLDDTNGLGYGIALYGNHLQATNNKISACKHAISSADRRFVNSDITYAFNQVRDTQLAAFDVHGTGEGVKIYENIIADIGKSYPGGGGIWIRGDHYEIFNNRITASLTRPGGVTNAGIKSIETASNDIHIHDNIIENFDYGYQSETYQTVSNLKFERNTITNSTNGVLGTSFSNSSFQGNKIFAKANGFYVTGLDHSVIADNEIHYSMSQWGVGIFLAGHSSAVSNNIMIQNNHISPMTPAADSHVRVQQGYDHLTVLDNQFDRSNGILSKSVQIEEDPDAVHTRIQSDRQ